MDLLIDERFELSDRDFERIRKLIYGRAGIALTEGKRSMVYSRLVRRLRLLGIDRFSRYLALLDDEQSEEWQPFINALTTNLTAFFREGHHFAALKTHLQDAALRDKRPWRIWCCAASTGEEPYSIAITAIEALGSNAPAVEIVATDIDTNVLDTARRGVYALEAVKGLDSAMLTRYFRRGVGANEGKVRVKDELSRLVSFAPLNLLAPDWPIKGQFDAIFCRNVMIYFDKPTQAVLLERLTPRLAPGGLFFAGHSENLSFARNLVEPCGQTIYRAAKRKD